MKKAIINGRIVLKDRIFEGGTLLFDQKILDILPSGAPIPHAEIIDAAGGIVMPGMIDLHVHGGGGADFLDGDEEAVKTVLKTHARHGTTSLLATTLTCGNETLFRGMETILHVMEGNYEGSEILGLHLEGPYFSGASRGAQNITSARIPTKKECEEIYRRAEGRIIRWDAAPELPNMEFFADWLREKGILASVGHSGANAECVLKMYPHGFRHITHLYCSTTTEHKEGEKVCAGIVEAAYLEDGITIELIGDGKHIPKETMLLAFKIKGPDKVALITDAMRAAGTDAEVSILGPRQDGLRVIIEDGVAKLPDRSSFAGSIATMDKVLKTALSYGMPLPDAVRAVTATPARLAGVFDRKGSFEAGKDADIVLLDKEYTAKAVFIGGRKEI